VLEICEEVENSAEAEMIAARRLWNENKNAVSSKFNIVCVPDIFSGDIISLNGFRYFDGNYFVEIVDYDFTNGLLSNVSARKIL
jgi:hypothetical protein